MSLWEQYEGMRQVELVDVAVVLPSVHPVVVLRERDQPGRELAFPIGQPEGVALAMAWKGAPAPRPLTHQVLTSAMAAFGVSLEVVRITGQEGRTYLAELVLVRGADREAVSCRPSDALTLALRQPVPVPIMVAHHLLEAAPPPPSEAPGVDPALVAHLGLDTEVWPTPDWARPPPEPTPPSNPKESP